MVFENIIDVAVGNIQRNGDIIKCKIGISKSVGMKRKLFNLMKIRHQQWVDFFLEFPILFTRDGQYRTLYMPDAAKYHIFNSRIDCLV